MTRAVLHLSRARACWQRKSALTTSCGRGVTPPPAAAHPRQMPLPAALRPHTAAKWGFGSWQCSLLVIRPWEQNCFLSQGARGEGAESEEEDQREAARKQSRLCDDHGAFRPRATFATGAWQRLLPSLQTPTLKLKSCVEEEVVTQTSLFPDFKNPTHKTKASSERHFWDNWKNVNME